MTDDKTSDWEDRMDLVDQEDDSEEPASEWKEQEPEDASDPVEPIAHDSRVIKGWKLFGASRRGKSHAHVGTYREDAFSLAVKRRRRGPPWWALIVADGAGSCSLSRVGANLAVRTVCESLLAAERAKTAWPDRLNVAVAAALTALHEESDRRECDLKDLSCTLLALLYVFEKRGRGGIACTFQAGDGLIAHVDDGGLMQIIGVQEYEAFAGATHFLNSDYVQETWDSRFKYLHCEKSPAGFLVMSDGVADDLVPYETNGPIIVRELFDSRDAHDPGPALADVLAYEKRGSFDDRTLICALRSDTAFVEKEMGKPATEGESSHDGSQVDIDAPSEDDK